VSAATAATGPRLNRWLPASIFVVTLIIASVLLFVRIPSTTIELVGTFNGLGFTSVAQQPLNGPLDVSSIAVAGLKDVQLPDEVARPTGAVGALRVSVGGGTDPKQQAGSIVVDRFDVPADTRVWISRTSLPRQYRITLRSDRPEPISIHVDVNGALVFTPAGAAPTLATLRAPQPVEISSTSGSLDLEVTLAQGVPPPRWQQIEARGLRVYQVQDDQKSDRPIVRPLSTLLTGSIYFESLGGNERKLRSGEMVRFASAVGTLLTLDLRDDGIAATFQGDVKGMTVGAGDRPRSIMPSLVTWLRQRQGLSLLWGTALYLFGVTTTLRKWWSS
jgi:hypothetical protein